MNNKIINNFFHKNLFFSYNYTIQQLNSHCFSIKYLYKTKKGPRGEIGRHKGLEKI